MTPLSACLRFLPVFLAGMLFSCEKEQPAKALPHFDLISANGTTKFKLVTGATNRVVSTTLLEQQYNVSGGTLQINAQAA